jgi:2-oxoacid dehydrogenases acyltransferase (catalytic domain).
MGHYHQSAQVAILAVGTIKKRPMVLETAEGDVIAIRHMMYLSLELRS